MQDIEVEAISRDSCLILSVIIFLFICLAIVCFPLSSILLRAYASSVYVYICLYLLPFNDSLPYL